VTQQVNQLHQTGFGIDGSTGNNFFSPLTVSTSGVSAGASITGFIANPALLTLDEYTITFDAGGNFSVTNRTSGAVAASGAYVSGSTISFDGIDVVVTGAVTPADSFFVSPLTTAISGTSVAVTDPNAVAASSSATELPDNNAIALQIAQLADAAQGTLNNATFSSYYGALVADTGAKKSAADASLSFDNNLLTALEDRRSSVSGVSLDEEAANLLRFQRSYEAGARMITITDELLQTILNL
jgi:flagellar hook-associated protein 1 FlgK